MELTCMCVSAHAREPANRAGKLRPRNIRAAISPGAFLNCLWFHVGLIGPTQRRKSSGVSPTRRGPTPCPDLRGPSGRCQPAPGPFSRALAESGGGTHGSSLGATFTGKEGPDSYAVLASASSCPAGALVLHQGSPPGSKLTYCVKYNGQAGLNIWIPQVWAGVTMGHVQGSTRSMFGWFLQQWHIMRPVAPVAPAVRAKLPGGERRAT